jgi:hypothetical protein
VVFDLNGLGRVGYVPVVHADPSDRPVPVAGAGALQVTIGVPDFRESGHQAWRTPWQLGQRLAGGGTTLREVRFAGTFEHVTTFAVGVSTRRPLPGLGPWLTTPTASLAWSSTSPTRLSTVTG